MVKKKEIDKKKEIPKKSKTMDEKMKSDGFKFVVKAHNDRYFTDINDARNYAIKLLETGMFFITLDNLG